MTIAQFITQQPTIIHHSLHDLPDQIRAALPAIPPEHIYLIGTGSSMNAFQASIQAFVRTAANLHLCSPLTFLAEKTCRRRHNSLAIILSQSGQSRDTLAATHQALAEQMKAIVVTAGRNTDMAKLDVGLVLLPAERETVGPKTMGYTASVIAIQLIGVLLSGTSPCIDDAPFVDDYARFVTAARNWSLNALPTFANADVILVLGQGRHLGSAQEGSLKIAEMSGIPSFGLETEEASHGRLHGLTRHSRTVLLASTADELDFAHRIARAMTHYHLHALVFDLTGTSMPTEAPTFRMNGLDIPLLHEDTLTAVVPFQWLGVHLAEQRGMVPEAMTYPDLTARLGIKLDGTNH
ncbi:SIS domain-containing protein [Salinicola peritrichatus]|uniref:SIS domain-containing protein n=1 Tax=Salinicola peritrichatus TaxID=1267424 RepID=UPI0013A626C0|nr:SIS domain-containing protein [Salinicola peritrichatus]